MRYLIGFMFVLAGLAVLPQSASAEAGEEGTTAEPASEEPVLQIQLSPDGVDVMPSPARTADGYTLEEMELRVRRARIGLLSMTGVSVVGVALFGAWAASARSAQDWDALSRGGLLVAGMAVGLTGVAGMMTRMCAPRIRAIPPLSG